MLRKLLLAVVLLALVGATVAVFAGRRDAQPALDVYGTLPAFSLNDQDGNAFTADDLGDNVTIANFIFTRCPTVCPAVTTTLRRIQSRTEGQSIMLLSFSVDPDFDTPEVLAAFSKKFSADPRRWKFVTGDANQIESTLVAGLNLALAKRGQTSAGIPDIVHGTHFVLIDRSRRIRGYYNSDDDQRIKALVRDASLLAR